MRSMDEQVNEILSRREVVREKRVNRRILAANAIASCVCVILIIASSFCLPKLAVTQSENGASQYGSLLLAAPYVGYVIIGVLAFALGICVTLFCCSWKKFREQE